MNSFIDADYDSSSIYSKGSILDDSFMKNTKSDSEFIYDYVERNRPKLKKEKPTKNQTSLIDVLDIIRTGSSLNEKQRSSIEINKSIKKVLYRPPIYSANPRENGERRLSAISRSITINLMPSTCLEKKDHILISYNKESRELCLKIKSELEKDGYQIWIDVEDIHGSCLESMALAIERSKCVLICEYLSLNLAIKLDWKYEVCVLILTSRKNDERERKRHISRVLYLIYRNFKIK